MRIGLRWFGRGSACSHQSTVEVTTNGLKRVVCEECGHVAIRPVTTMVSDIDRSRFARRSLEGTHAEPNTM
jgi:hypothetical protein